LVEAEELARSAVAFSRLSDGAQTQADALCELAAVLAIVKRRDDAKQAIDEAIAIFQAKGDVVSSGRAASWAATLD
jgi:Flp pilus assembly protein TadD